jgi:hypothetical protein
MTRLWTITPCYARDKLPIHRLNHGWIFLPIAKVLAGDKIPLNVQNTAVDKTAVALTNRGNTTIPSAKERAR